MKTLKTQIHFYCFNVRNSEENAAYMALRETIKAQCPEGRGEWMNVFAMPGSKEMKEPAHGTQDIELETAHLFENQWNSTTARVFDWYEGINPHSRHIKFGHWLTITPEMVQVRRETLTCGYCGHFYGPERTAIPTNGFCEKCLGNQYLKASELHLLRLVPVCDNRESRAPLSEAERADLLPKFEEMRRTCDLERASAARKRERENIENEWREFQTTKMEQAKEEHEGMLWIWEHGFSVDNWIYYSHTRTFCLGWREPVDAALKSRWLDVAAEFPFNYEVKSTAGSVERKNEPAR